VAGAGVRISVVIPTLDEAATVAQAIAAAREALPDPEVIVVDAGSGDGTAAAAAAAGAAVLAAPGTRAEAMNAGAAAAHGDVLVFLHADTLLPAGAGAAIVPATVAVSSSVGITTENLTPGPAGGRGSGACSREPAPASG